jgi:hypothetical protein
MIGLARSRKRLRTEGPLEVPNLCTQMSNYDKRKIVRKVKRRFAAPVGTWCG